jgi:hypothetical protein
MSTEWSEGEGEEEVVYPLLLGCSYSKPGIILIDGVSAKAWLLRFMSAGAAS